jgi:hypothetical protein
MAIASTKWGPCHFTKKKYLKAKEEELWKLKYFSMPKYNLQKNPLKETKILQRYYYNSITNLKFQHKAKISSFKNAHIKNRPIIYYLGPKIP